jgi:diguanylate cyclase (GGDEF)-like protein
MSHYFRGKPTIGVLPGWSAYQQSSPDRYLSTVIRGILSAAHSLNCNLLLAWGVGRVVGESSIHPAWPVISPDSDFVPVGQWNTDGIIVFAPLRNEKRSLFIQNITDGGHPVLFIAKGEKGPSIFADNEGGIRLAMDHLVEHGHRQIAFIAGNPNDPGDSALRYKSYGENMDRLGLDANPRLIAYGMHTIPGGYNAMLEIIKTKIKFSAVLASNDVSAIGALNALRENGFRVPRDVALIGFDDQPDAMAQIPPITSIQVPLFKMGYKAVQMMVDHLEGHAGLASTIVPTKLIPRQSCGCIPNVMLFPPSHQISTNRDNGVRKTKEQTKQNMLPAKIIKDILLALPEAEQERDGIILSQLITKLVQAFFEGFKNSESINFERSILDLIQEIERSYADINLFQKVISVLRYQFYKDQGSILQQKEQLFAEDLFHKVRVAISESAQRIDNRYKFESDINNHNLSILITRLSSSLDEHTAIKILDENLPEIGIRYSKVFLFKPEKNDPVAFSSLIRSTVDEKINEQFSTREFPPKGLFSPDELLNIVLIPIVFQNVHFGYAAFDIADLTACATISRQLASTLMASKLHSNIIELSITDALTGLYNRRHLNSILENEMARCARNKQSFSMILMDIDLFKKYNDNFGHPSGDEALRQVAKCIQSIGRKVDTAARFGGDEFALVLPDTNVHGALIIAERVASEVNKLSELKSSITLSMGVASLKASEFTLEELVQHADQALYNAKQSGRGRACVFQ